MHICIPSPHPNTNSILGHHQQNFQFAVQTIEALESAKVKMLDVNAGGIILTSHTKVCEDLQILSTYTLICEYREKLFTKMTNGSSKLKFIRTEPAQQVVTPNYLFIFKGSKLEIYHYV